MKKHLIACTTLALSLLTLSAQAKVIEQSFAVDQGGKLSIDTHIGSLKVTSHDQDRVAIEVNIKGRDEDKFEVNFDHSGNDVSVSGDHTDNGHTGWHGNHIKVTYTIKVPHNYNLNLDTNGGSIEISNLAGKIDAHTSGGSISLGHIDGLVDVNTSGGSIDVDEVTGTINARTSGGSINASISKQPTGDSKLSTSGGSITVYLAKDIAVDLNAHTNGGRVSSDFTVDGRIKKKSIRGSINGGGPDLVLKTSGGNVKIRKR
jgi:DUF4097 and DUF4098 domain-containing protein YvlB